MPFITNKSRYKEFGLVVYYEYDETQRVGESLPKSESITTMHRDTTFESQLSLIQHTVKEGETIHKLSLHYYRDAKLWWFIADYNPLIDFRILKVGDVVTIPPNTEVNAY